MTASVTKTVNRLADGRELFYFDEHPGIDRSQPDRRDIVTTCWSTSGW
jgi:UDPglucose--hexose-1-phosphate uridylyltransferase